LPGAGRGGQNEHRRMDIFSPLMGFYNFACRILFLQGFIEKERLGLKVRENIGCVSLKLMYNLAVS
jgi:hypothetical protein